MSDRINLSIVVPVYNVEQFLETCIDSLLASRGIEAAEIILIDDGSTDDSSAIVDRLSDEHDNIFSYHIEKSGPSIARNFGLNKARGKYVFFCDSDDMVVSEIFSQVINMTRECDSDILLWDAILVDGNGNKSDRKDCDYYIHRGLDTSGGVITGKDAVEQQLISRGDYPATVWLGVFKCSFLSEYGLSFKEGILHEDELWAQEVLLCARSVQYIPEIIYLYRIHDGSITNPVVKDWTKHIESLLYVYPALFAFSDEHLTEGPLKRMFDAAIAHRYLYMIYKYDFYKYGYGKAIDIGSLWKKSTSLKAKLKIVLLWIKGIWY